MAQRKFCVFCGEKPVSKTDEDIIPKWLVKLTGDPTRTAFIGTGFGRLPVKKIPWKAFLFPACYECNNYYGNKLEGRAKSVVKSLLNEEPMSAEDFDVFLTWLDKIRIGLYLGQYHYLGRNRFNFTRPFHIDSGIDRYDRLVGIYRSTNKTKGITFSGTELPAFAFSPSCFALWINQYVLFNVTFPLICSKGLGLWYAPSYHMVKPGMLAHQVLPVQGSAKVPPVDFTVDVRGSAILQPIVHRSLIDAFVSDVGTKEAEELMASTSGKDTPYLYKDGKVLEYPNQLSKAWIPSYEHSPLTITCLISLQILQTLNYLIALPSYKSLEEPSRTRGEQIRSILLSSNQKFYRYTIEQCRHGKYPV